MMNILMHYIKKIEDLYEIYPDSLARYLSLALYKWAEDVSTGKT